MNVTRTVMWLVGLVVLVLGAYMIYFEAGLDRWVSLGIVGAGLLIFIGLSVMAFAGGARNDPPTRVVREPPTVVERAPREVVEVERKPRRVVEADDRVSR